MPWNATAPYRVNFERIEEGKRVRYYHVPAAYEQPNVDTIVYDLGRARVIVWD